jgi:serine/threonine protein kinase
MLFDKDIKDEKAWAEINKQIDVFKPLIANILKRESLPLNNISSVKQSTNAVFKVDNLIIKIFKPNVLGHDTECDYKSELFGQSRASSLGLTVPKILASGIIKDKYDFYYIISEFMDGVELDRVFGSMESNRKYAIGRKLREITDKLNTPCEQFNNIDYPEGIVTDGYNGWLIDLGYQKKFIDGRKKYIHSLNINKNDLVFCHGDMAICNVLYDSNEELHIIDFACSALAPVCVDHSYVAFWTNFDKAFINGYFGNISINELINIWFNGFLLSINGIDFLANGLDFGFIDGKACESIDDFKIKCREYIENKIL